MSNFISLQKAVDMTSLFRQEKEKILQDNLQGLDILANNETFEKSQIESILSKTECKKLRIYYGMDESKKIHAILVGVDVNNQDILPMQTTKDDSSVDVIIEDAERCPPLCPPPSPLNP